MSFALKELSRLLTTDTPVVGAVVGIDGAVVRVATERGAVTARALDAVTVGDRVQIKNGIATRAPVAKQVFPV
jgi:ribosomal protein L35AE/L33A